ncbi:MAG: Mur ligase family protein, partial [Candidatus Omnitrophica bacterium]|nr:Mur ligase family protein [Candidatus Omnitrophota bacterium]
MRLKKLLRFLKNYRVFSLNKGNPLVKGITSNSKEVKAGFIFVAIRGSKFDGNDFIAEAIKNKAVAVVSENKPSLKEFIWIKVQDTHKALGILLNKFYGDPSRRLKVVGITGTNGKTTLSYILEKIIIANKRKCGVIGTINYRFENKIFPALNTTPSPERLIGLLNEMAKENLDYVVM